MEEYLRKELSKKVDKLERFSQGWRGVIYVGEYKGLKVAVKLAKDEYRVRAINKEADILERLKGIDYFPQLLFRGHGYFAYKFIEGIPFRKYVKNVDRKEKIYLLTEVLKAAFLLDRMGINRGEFSNIDKNVLVGEGMKVYILDFDRGSFKERSSNLPQFLQFLVRESIIELERAVELGKRYKNDKEGVYEEVLSIIKGCL